MPDAKELTIFLVTPINGGNPGRLIEAESLAKLRARLSAETWTMQTASSRDVADAYANGIKMEPAA